MFRNTTNPEQEEEEQEENPTELVVKKDGSSVHIWALIDGEEIFHAAPHVRASTRSVYAAIQTFFSRAFEDEIPQLQNDGNNDSRRFI